MVTPSCKMSWEIRFPAKENRDAGMAWASPDSSLGACITAPLPNKLEILLADGPAATRVGAAGGWEMGFRLIQTVSSWLGKMAATSCLQCCGKYCEFQLSYCSLLIYSQEDDYAEQRDLSCLTESSREIRLH